jgi:hypothetical protein
VDDRCAATRAAVRAQRGRGDSLAGGSARRSIASFGPGSIRVTLTAEPAPTVWALEETLPPGTTPSEVSDGGMFDPVSRTIRWGPFFDASVRSVSYRATTPAGSSIATELRGRLSFDGAEAAVR